MGVSLGVVERVVVPLPENNEERDRHLERRRPLSLRRGAAEMACGWSTGADASTGAAGAESDLDFLRTTDEGALFVCQASLVDVSPMALW